MSQRTVLQAESSECGLACLAMVADFHGLRLDLAEMRRRFAVSLKGATLSTLIRYGAKLGLSSRPLQLGMDELRQLKLPCILHWDLNHFVVLNRIRGKYIWVLDPAVGERRLTFDQVSASFTGIALELTPNTKFQPEDVRQVVRWRDLVSPIEGLFRSGTQIFLLALALEIFVMVAPLFNQFVVDEVILTADKELLWVVSIGFAFLLVTQTAIEWFRSWLVLKMSTEVRSQWSLSLFAHLLKLPPAFFEKRHLGDIVSRFGSLAAMQKTLTTALITAVLDGIMALLTLAMMLVYSPMLTLVVVAAVGAFALLRWAFYPALRDAVQEKLNLSARENSYFLETVRGIVPIKLAGREVERGLRWGHLFGDVLDREYREQSLSNLANVLVHFVLGATTLLTLALGANLVIQSVLTVGMLMAFNSYAGTFVTRITSLVGFVMDLQMLGLHRERLSDIALESPEQDVPVETDLSRLDASIELRNVKFRYAEGEPLVLDGINLTIRSGESVAITGPSGCGKTTLMKLLLGLLEPTEGEILYGGVPVKRLGLSAYRSQLSAVLQDDSLMAGSLAENIAFISNSIDMAQVEACARMAAIHDEIAAMPMGYQTMVGDMGSTLSGGQKQRLLLARALYQQPKVLLLDEATSHLDVHNEKAVNTAILGLGITRILVAHRQETIASARRVISLGTSEVLECLT